MYNVIVEAHVDDNTAHNDDASAHSKCMWVVVKIMVPFWIPIIIRHLIFMVPKKGP